jgi:hypothetical protein
METPELNREVSMPGSFRLRVPEATKPELVDDGETLALPIKVGCEPIYLKRYSLDEPYDPNGSSLEDEAKRFLEDGILPVVERIVGADVERGTVNDCDFAQLVVSVDASRWWIARLVSRPKLGHYFLLHCVGDKDLMILAVAVFSEFCILN